jgi:hypothetical protein
MLFASEPCSLRMNKVACKFTRRAHGACLRLKVETMRTAEDDRKRLKQKPLPRPRTALFASHLLSGLAYIKADKVATMVPALARLETPHSTIGRA